MAEAFGIACHELVSLDFRCGSTTDFRDPPLPRPKLGDKQTKSGVKRTLPLWERPALRSDYFLGLVGFLVLRWTLTFRSGFRPRPIFFASSLRVAA